MCTWCLSQWLMWALTNYPDIAIRNSQLGGSNYSPYVFKLKQELTEKFASQVNFIWKPVPC